MMLFDRDTIQLQIHSSRSAPKLLELEEVTGDIFKAPPKNVLLHACNCKGSWGAGIAAAFKGHYPMAYKDYKEYCAKFNATSLAGTAYIIHPVDRNGCQHYIGCLFTSIGFGKWKDSPKKILSNTESAVKDILKQISALRDDGIGIGDIYMCQINSGYFGVPWTDTKALLEAMEIEGREQKRITVVCKT